MTLHDNAATVTDMALDYAGLRARLAATPIEDVDAVHDLYLESKKLTALARGTEDWVPVCEVARRADRAIGLAIRAAQERGEVRSKGQRTNTEKVARSTGEFVSRGESADIYPMSDGVSDAMFEEAVRRVRETHEPKTIRGAVTRRRLVAELARMKSGEGLRLVGTDKALARLAKPSAVKPSPRGKRTIEHLAIQMNAIALGVQELDPGEVDPVECREMIFGAFEDIGVIRSFLRKVNRNAS